MTGIGSAEPGPAVVCTIVDVFAERPLSGNQLAVVRGGAHLDTVTMQAIALEMNFSETTFVVEERSDEARARIFTPVRELPFAGHPTLGTAWGLRRDRDSYTLDLPAGRVPVTFEAGGIAWMQPPPVEPGAVLSSQSAAALLGLLRSGGLLVAAYAATTLFDNSFMSLFPAFGLRLGLDEAEISLILSCLLLGGALAQVPIGWIIDRSSVFTALAACSLMSPPRTRARPATSRTSRIPTGVCQRRPRISRDVMPEASPVSAAPCRTNPSPAARRARRASTDACRDKGLHNRSVALPKTIRTRTSPVLPSTPRYRRNFARTDASSQESSTDHLTRNVNAPRIACPSAATPRHSIL